MNEREESDWSDVRQANERKDQGEGEQDRVWSALVYGADTLEFKEGTGKYIGGRINENATMAVRSCEAGQDKQ